MPHHLSHAERHVAGILRNREDEAINVRLFCFAEFSMPNPATVCDA